jgi:glycosyltransferase involved in cell wall biosynthesis
MTESFSPNLSVVIPFYKCESTIEELISRVFALEPQLGRIEVVLIDDASPNFEPYLIESISHKHASLKYFRLPRNRGQHYATLFGVKQSSGKNVAILDCDLENSPEDLLALLDELPNLDCVVAQSRFRSKTGPIRRSIRKLYAQLLSRALGFNVSTTGISSFSFCILGPRSVAIAKELRLTTIPLSISLLQSDLRIGSRTVDVVPNMSRKSTYRVAENIDVALRTLLFSGKFFRIVLIRLLLIQFVALALIIALILYQVFRFGSSDGWYSFLLVSVLLSFIATCTLIAVLLVGSIQAE